MSKKNYFFLFWSVLLLVFSLKAEAASSVPAEGVKEFLQNIQSLSFPVTDVTRHNQLVAEAHAHLDLEVMAKKALGDSWNNASAEERTAFMELLWELIANIAYPKTRKFLEGQTLLYQDPQPLEKGFSVETLARNPETELDVPVVYYLEDEKERWKIYDIFLDDISMTEDLGYQFDKLIRDSGFSGLLDRMRERLTQAKAENFPS